MPHTYTEANLFCMRTVLSPEEAEPEVLPGQDGEAARTSKEISKVCQVYTLQALKLRSGVSGEITTHLEITTHQR